MIPSRLVVVRTALLLIAAVLTASFLPRWGVTADLVLALVVAVGLRSGSQAGALFGVVAGLLVDLVPPGGAPLGLTALVYAGVGAAVGLVQPWLRASVLVPLLVVLAAATGIQFVRFATRLANHVAFDWAASGRLIMFTALAGALIVPLMMRWENYLDERGLA